MGYPVGRGHRGDVLSPEMSKPDIQPQETAICKDSEVYTELYTPTHPQTLTIDYHVKGIDRSTQIDDFVYR